MPKTAEIYDFQNPGDIPDGRYICEYLDENGERLYGDSISVVEGNVQTGSSLFFNAAAANRLLNSQKVTPVNDYGRAVKFPYRVIFPELLLNRPVMEVIQDGALCDLFPETHSVRVMYPQGQTKRFGKNTAQMPKWAKW